MQITATSLQSVPLTAAPADLRTHRGPAWVLADPMPLALVTVWRNALHPTLLHFDFGLTAAGTTYAPAALADALISTVVTHAKATSFRGVILSTDRPLTPLLAALLSRGLRRVRTTFMPTLMLAAGTLPEAALPAGMQLVSAATIRQTPALQAQLLTQTFAAYTAAHQVNPAAATAPSNWPSLMLRDLVPDVPVALVHAQTLMAYCLVYTNDATSVDFGYAWGQDAAALAHLAPQTLSALAGSYQRLNGEFDDTDPFAMQIARYFPPVEGPELAAYTLVF
ncbi:hypothetical protein [Lacticaseibacillus daqingensis]|uniref:hypothetical protein n=1 Tax=Lacticaseibacillus daqingensis TaxID=2486014 RepID=UPI000F7679BD|nr:hypothetical protein [Lacticaseibacillus daqingensis]